MHFQIEPFAEEKLITCIQGSIFDVIVDLRPHSLTYGKWASFELSATNSLQLYLPKGVAHGFQTLVPDSIVHYCLSSTYSRESSFAINPFGDLEIPWPIKKSIFSERDASGLSLSEAGQKYSLSLEK
jgi:dTDP-4-dehydrorhamnose 3,5-epimerase